jgi:hypothetical protein
MAAKTMSFTSVRAEEHVISEANGRQSREQIVLDVPAANVLAGTVLGKVTASGQYRPLDLEALTGEEVAAAIQCVTEVALDPAADIRTSAHVRDAEMNGWKLIWPDGITDNEKAAAEAELAEAGILVRY